MLGADCEMAYSCSKVLVLNQNESATGNPAHVPQSWTTLQHYQVLGSSNAFSSCKSWPMIRSALSTIPQALPTTPTSRAHRTAPPLTVKPPTAHCSSPAPHHPPDSVPTVTRTCTCTHTRTCIRMPHPPRLRPHAPPTMSHSHNP